MFRDIDSDAARLMTYALVAPDTRAEALVKRLKGTEYELYINATDNSYALGNGYEGRIYAFTPCIDEIEGWLARRVAPSAKPSGPH